MITNNRFTQIMFWCFILFFGTCTIFCDAISTKKDMSTKDKKVVATKKVELLNEEFKPYRKTVSNNLQTIYSIAAAVENRQCPILLPLGDNNIVRIDYRGLNLMKSKQIPEKKVGFAESIPELVGTMRQEAKTEHPHENFCYSLKERGGLEIIKQYVYSETMMDLINKRYTDITDQQRADFISTTFQYTENLQDQCQLNEDDVLAIQLGAIKMVNVSIQNVNRNSFTECPWEICKSDDGQTTVYSMIVMTSTFMAIIVAALMTIEYKKTRERKKILSHEDYKPPPIITQKQKMIRLGKLVTKATIILINIGLLLIPKSTVRNKVCDLEPNQHYYNAWEN